MKKVLLVLIVFAVLAAGVGYYIVFSEKVESYVLLSINPEIELALNEDNNVVDVLALNDDADVLISDLKLEGMSIEEATNVIIDEATETGYLDEYSEDNDIIITTINDDEKVRVDLENKVLTNLNTQLQSNGVASVVVVTGVTEEMKSDADLYGISYGKMLLVEKALVVNADLNKENLVTLSVKEIQSLIKDNLTKQNETSAQTLEEKVQIKEKLKTETKEKIKLYEDKLLEEKGINSTTMTQEQKQEAVNNASEEKKNEIQNKVNEVQEQAEQNIQEEQPDNIQDSISAARNQVQSKGNK